MTTPCIITVAITGAVPRTKDNPAVPVTPVKQIESTQEAFEAGASLVHIHVRDEQENPSSDVGRFSEILDGVQKYCPGMIIQFSTGGRGRAASERGAMLHLAPDMASLATGSVNFPNAIYDNHPALINELAQKMLDHHIKPEIEVFDLAMLYNAGNLARDGMLVEPIHVQFVFGVPNALPPVRHILEFEVSELRRLFPDATWTAAGVGRSQLELNHWSLELGGHCRTGLEDNIRFDKTRLATSNAELVGRVADLCTQYDRHAASSTEARELLSLG
jgi:3-keto-5-aminohexanoate cleavage enzyme